MAQKGQKGSKKQTKKIETQEGRKIVGGKTGDACPSCGKPHGSCVC